MLVALDREGKLVLAEAAEKNQKFHCPACGEAVILRKGAVKLPHFAHQRHSECSQAFSEAESHEHLLGKRQLLSLFGPQARLEVYLPELQQRPDLLVGQTAIEYQCSPLDFRRFTQRTAGYLANNYQPLWILGSRFSPTKRLSEFQKGCCFYRNRRLQLWHLDSRQQFFEVTADLHWHYSGQFLYQTKKVRLPELARLEHLSLPAPLVPDWSTEEYRQILWEKLVRMDRGLVSLQQVCYERGDHLLKLPEWTYQRSSFHFFYGHRLLLLRLFYLQAKDYGEWRKLVERQFPEWLFPLIPQEFILRGIYQECASLTAADRKDQIRHGLW